MPEADENISALYAKSKSQLEPPERLDASILGAARASHRPRYRRIYPAMGLAATLTIGVGLAGLYFGPTPHQAPTPASTESQPIVERAEVANELAPHSLRSKAMSEQAAIPAAPASAEQRRLDTADPALASDQPVAAAEPLAAGAALLDQDLEACDKTSDNGDAATAVDAHNTKCLQRGIEQPTSATPE